VVDFFPDHTLQCLIFRDYISSFFYFSSLVLFQKKFMISIQSLNYNLSYIFFFNLIFILLISHFDHWLFC
jgi:hypothetical protein